MAAPSKEMLEQATHVAETIARMGRDLFRGIWLTDWRGWRLVYDIKSPGTCDNDCQNCRLFQMNQDLLEMEKGLPFKLALFPWETQIDKDHYGPEPYLNCKTAWRQAQCFVVYMLQHPECVDAEHLQSELELVRDLRCVYETGILPDLRRIQQYIVFTTIQGLEWKRRQLMPDILARLRWDGRQFT